MTVNETAPIGMQEEEPSALNERVMHQSNRHDNRMHECCVREQVCLRKEANCGTGNVQ